MIGLAVSETLYTPRDFMARAHAAGKRAVFWTLNSPEEMAACLAAGADGFFTDDVPMGRAALATANLLRQDASPCDELASLRDNGTVSPEFQS